MHIRKLFQILIFASLLFGTPFSPAIAIEDELLQARSHILIKANPAAPQFPTATYTVCANGCDFSCIQTAIDAASEDDTINLVAETFTETITIDKSISLIGEGAENTIIQAAGESGIATSRVITVTTGITTSIEGLTIRHGNAVGSAPRNEGGGIYSLGFLTLREVEVSDNTAGGHGGGVRTPNSTLVGRLTINNSSITGNTTIQSSGGALRNLGVVSISNSTISGNHATGSGGAIHQWGDIREMIRLYHVTFSDNSSDSNGNDIFRYQGSFSSQSCIFASNNGGNSCSGYSVGSLGFNLGIDDSCGLNQLTDLPNTDPILGPLADNDGDTLTHALAPDSPAIDHGSCLGPNGSLLTTDQRGSPRPQGLGCDMGAYEALSFTIFKTVDGPHPLPGQIITYTIQVMNATAETLNDGLIFDNLPTRLSFQGPITLEPPSSGTVGSAPPTLVSNLTILPEQQITVTLPVSISYGLTAGTLITNTAVFTTARGAFHFWGRYEKIGQQRKGEVADETQSRKTKGRISG